MKKLVYFLIYEFATKIYQKRALQIPPLNAYNLMKDAH